MKKLILLGVGIVFMLSQFTLFSQNVFNKGVNLTGWFQTSSTKSIAFSQFNKKDFENIKSLGCDVIRLPINLHFYTNGAPDYTIDPLFFTFLDQAVSWAEEVQIKLILDNHTIDGANSTAVEIPLLKVWPQMAKRYKDRSDYIIYEILNEPNVMSTAQWNVIQKKAIDSIRAYDSKHAIVVGGSGYNGIGEMTKLPIYSDPNIIYTFHFYDPFLFTHQGATWPNPSLGDLAGVPFPYDAARMPACPASLLTTWVKGSLETSYKTDGTVAKLKSTLDIAKNFASLKGVRVYCGELGVYNRNSLDADRVMWYHEVCTYLDEIQIPWSMWDYQGGFGLFKKGTNENFDYDLNIPMIEGMGFTVPEQKEFVFRPDSVEFSVYSDFAGENILSRSNPASGTVDFYSSESRYGDYSVYITGVPQYTAVEFYFKNVRDLTKLKDGNFAVDFWVKGDSPSANFVMRFIDTKTTDPADHPWRMDFTVNNYFGPFDGSWHHVNVPLKNFHDAGSWDGAWFGPANKFDWTAIDRFQIVSENMAFTDKKFWLDNILVTDNISLSAENHPEENSLSVFPNPASDLVQISCRSKILTLYLTDLSGRLIFSSHPGTLKTSLEINNLKSGIYIVNAHTINGRETAKLIIK